MQPRDYVNEFLKENTVESVAESVDELGEYNTENASYSFGNRELLIYPTDSDETIVYYADDFGFGPLLVLG